MKLIFMGTAEFGLPTLEKISRFYPPELVVTQPDRPAGRGQRIRKSPIKKKAEQMDVEISQPSDINRPSFIGKLQKIDPDVLLVVAYGQILGEEILALPSIGPINLHGSLLPKLRGPAPINWAIIKGHQRTGVTTIFMDQGVDTGDILLQKEVPINEDDTAGTLHDSLAKMGADLVIDTLHGLEKKELEPQPQDPGGASYAPKLKKEDGKIDWTKSSQKIHNQIRGMNPYPGAFTYLDGMRLKIHRSKKAGGSTPESPGRVMDFTDTGILVSTGGGVLELLELQPEARSRMSGADFVNGYGLQIGDSFG